MGATGAKLINYVECAEDGYNSGRRLCLEKGIPGYPTWEIGGSFYGGEMSLSELAVLSKFKNPKFDFAGDAIDEDDLPKPMRRDDKGKLVVQR